MQDRVFSSSRDFCRSSIPHAGSVRTALVSWLLFIACGWSVIAGTTAQAASDPNNILLDFSAKWCGPCQQMSSIVSKLERENYPIRKVDVDEEKGLTRQYQVESIPCFILIVNGREINRVTGATDEKTLRQMMMMLPKHNIDDTMLGKSARPTGRLIPTSNADATNPGEKKLFPKIPSLFAKNQDAKLTPTSTTDTVRGQNPGQDASDGFTSDPLTASTRIRVKDGSRVHFGSGTVIDSQSGHSVILTCGHIFRDLAKDAVVEVDYFAPGKTKPQTVVGRILQYDLTSDLGLLEIPSPQRVATIKLAAAAEGLAVGDRLTSVGCGGGERPSVQEHRVTSINRYRGPDNVECNGVPQQGRSGGGLFLDAELVGVCIAADPKDKRGIYTGMKPVAELLGKAKLGHLVSSPSADTALAENDPVSGPGEAALGSAVAVNNDASRRSDDDEVAKIIEEATRGAGNPNSSSADYVGAEVVCIVRPKTPGAMSRVVIVNQASSRFVDDLLHESNGARRTDTSASVQKTAPKGSSAKRVTADIAMSESRMATQKPAVDKTAKDADLPIETSFETQRYRRKRD